MICKNCLQEFKVGRSSYGIYCSLKCQGEFSTKKATQNWLDGKIEGWTGKTRKLKPFVIKHLKLTRGSQCCKCGWDGKHPSDGKSLTEINHIDGDAENCSPENLEILCPNCHSMTSNFRNRNKESKRKRT